MTPDPIWTEAVMLAAAHRTTLRAAAPSERPALRREILRKLRTDMVEVRESMARNAFARHKVLYSAFRVALDETADTGAVKAHA
jgi:predicted NAD-dependent protein-ADP-ribosyltransferase YbiA (DUF1768 family)